MLDPRKTAWLGAFFQPDALDLGQPIAVMTPLKTLRTNRAGTAGVVEQKDPRGSRRLALRIRLSDSCFDWRQ